MRDGQRITHLKFINYSMYLKSSIQVVTLMDSRLTSQQYRNLAEGLLKNAIDAPKQQNQNFVRDAIAYLAYARAQDERNGSIETPEPTELENRESAEGQYRQVQQLIKQALEVPTPEGLESFLEFSKNFRRLSIWNARMAYIQRPGARVIASEYEWKNVKRFVHPDAVPIIILWPFSPIRFVYELEDTGPIIDRETIKDPFAVKGELHPKVLPALITGLKKQKGFRIKIEARRKGYNSAGSAAAQGTLPIRPLNNTLDNRIGEFVYDNAASSAQPAIGRIPSYRITVNDRLEPKERFVTIAHELGHIFCGHLGKCTSHLTTDEESGWPDRTSLGKHEMEVEAEAVAYLVASRAGVVAASAEYLKVHASRADISMIDIDLVVRAAARIERLAKIRYGSMIFKAPNK
jgi:IrrE N-terminal-like domain